MIAAIAAVIIIPVTVWLRQRKALSYEVLSDTTVLTVNEGEQVKGRVQVLFDNKPVEDVHVVELRLWNSGNAPIKREDFDQNKPIEIELGKGAQVLEVDVLETTPTGIKDEVKGSLKSNYGTVMVSPILLNSQDSIKLKVVISKFQGDVALDKTRIIGGQALNWHKSF